MPDVTGFRRQPLGLLLPGYQPVVLVSVLKDDDGFVVPVIVVIVIEAVAAAILPMTVAVLVFGGASTARGSILRASTELSPLAAVSRPARSRIPALKTRNPSR
jgi:hypothetical protein